MDIAVVGEALVAATLQGSGNLPSSILSLGGAVQLVQLAKALGGFLKVWLS